jgi:hypothetical protein
MESVDLNILQAMGTLNIPLSLIDHIGNSENCNEAITKWSALLPVFKSFWKNKVRDTHPDHGGESEDFLLIQKAWEKIQDRSFPIICWKLNQQSSKKVQNSGIFDFREPSFLRR